MPCRRRSPNSAHGRQLEAERRPRVAAGAALRVRLIEQVCLALPAALLQDKPAVALAVQRRGAVAGMPAQAAQAAVADVLAGR